MSKTISKFRFKQFAVDHHRSSMKVGVDGVLIGCWTDTDGAHRILDVGTGCGLIALIMAQRAQTALVDAIDIDLPSIMEASENFSSAPWADRLRALQADFSEVSAGRHNDFTGYDLVVSNPPYFDSGVKEAATARERARHQGALSPSSLLIGAKSLLNAEGRVSMVVPADRAADIEEVGSSSGFTIEKKCFVRGHESAPYKRVLLQWRLDGGGLTLSGCHPESLTLELSPGIPTDEYRALCKDFYLRF